MYTVLNNNYLSKCPPWLLCRSQRSQLVKLFFNSTPTSVLCQIGDFGCGPGGWTPVMKINGSEVWNFWMRFLSKFFQIPIGPGMVDKRPLRESQCELSLRRRKGRFAWITSNLLKVTAAQTFWTRQACFFSWNCFFFSFFLSASIHLLIKRWS